jgi:Co/Zn/Cd efflux system component
MPHDPAHSHDSDHGNPAAERGTRLVLWITLAMMVGEIVALLGGMRFGWTWLDPAIGLVGAALVTRWAIGWLREGGRGLLDREMRLTTTAPALTAWDVRGHLAHFSTRVHATVEIDYSPLP